jgi:RNase H-fold protein (predicted Holliday junction resolvase)
MGNGTASKEFHDYLKSRINLEVLVVDEKNTTLEARKLYWKIHEPGFMMRLLPESIRVPSRVLDDLAAWSIGIRAVKKYRDIKENKL